MTQPPGSPEEPTGRDPLPDDGAAPADPLTPPAQATPAEPTPDDPTVPWTPPPAADHIDEPVAPPLTPAAGEPYFPGSPTDVAPSGLDAPAAPPPDLAPPQAPASPLISWSPSGGTPGSPTGTEPSGQGPVVGWQVPAQRPVETAEGYRLAGIAPRLVAYFLDSILISIIPTILSLILVDYGAYIREVIETMAIDPTTGMPIEPMTPVPVTTEIVLLTVISTALSYLYFVGFWTSRGQATPGMRGLGMRLVDVTGGTTLTLTQATKRWLGYGAPLALLAFVPPFQAIAGLLQLGVSLILLVTAATDDRKQGLHDRWADSIVIRSRSSGAAATAIGCLLLGLIAIAFMVLVVTFVLGAIAPDLIDVLETYEAVP